MEAVIKTPLDFQETLVFRRLADFLGSVEQPRSHEAQPPQPDVIKASYVYHSIFRDLAYMAREGRDPGRVTVSDVPLFHKILARVTSEVEPLWASLVGQGDQPIRLFVPDGDDFLCRPFADRNTHLMPGFQSKEALGGHVKAHNNLSKSARTVDFQMSLNIGEALLRDAEGVPLPAEMVRRLKWFVPTLDNALELPFRHASQYSPDLVQNAVKVLMKYSDEMLERVTRYILKNRKHPALARRPTEEIVVIFDQVVEAMG
jgi:hypothetical protein